VGIEDLALIYVIECSLFSSKSFIVNVLNLMKYSSYFYSYCFLLKLMLFVV